MERLASAFTVPAMHIKEYKKNILTSSVFFHTITRYITEEMYCIFLGYFRILAYIMILNEISCLDK